MCYRVRITRWKVFENRLNNFGMVRATVFRDDNRTTKPTSQYFQETVFGLREIKH